MNVGDTVSENDSGQIWLIARINPGTGEYHLERTISNYTTLHIKMDYSKLMTNYKLVNIADPELPVGRGNSILLRDLDKAYEDLKKSESHEDHEVIENYAGGKKFLYCRKCKVEV